MVVARGLRVLELWCSVAFKGGSSLLWLRRVVKLCLGLTARWRTSLILLSLSLSLVRIAGGLFGGLELRCTTRIGSLVGRVKRFVLILRQRGF